MTDSIRTVLSRRESCPRFTACTRTAAAVSTGVGAEYFAFAERHALHSLSSFPDVAKLPQAHLAGGGGGPGGGAAVLRLELLPRPKKPIGGGLRPAHQL